MDILNLVLGGLTLASILGTASAVFYGVRQRTVITILEQSNQAYKERNEQLESTMKDRDAKYAKDIAELQGKVSVLENLKTPPLSPLMKQIDANHKEVMIAIKGKRKL